MERSLLGHARVELRSNHLLAAERAIEDHRRRFPDGQLAEERDALEIRLRVQQGRLGEARQAVRRFRARYPASIQPLPVLPEGAGGSR